MLFFKAFLTPALPISSRCTALPPFSGGDDEPTVEELFDAYRKTFCDLCGAFCARPPKPSAIPPIVNQLDMAFRRNPSSVY